MHNVLKYNAFVMIFLNRNHYIALNGSVNYVIINQEALHGNYKTKEQKKRELSMFTSRILIEIRLQSSLNRLENSLEGTMNQLAK